MRFDDMYEVYEREKRKRDRWVNRKVDSRYGFDDDYGDNDEPRKPKRSRRDYDQERRSRPDWEDELFEVYRPQRLKINARNLAEVLD